MIGSKDVHLICKRLSTAWVQQAGPEAQLNLHAPHSKDESCTILVQDTAHNAQESSFTSVSSQALNQSNVAHREAKPSQSTSSVKPDCSSHACVE